jgi:TonB family protein
MSARRHRLLAIPFSALLALALLAGLPGAAWADGPKVLKKVPPEFPAEAARKGVTEGVLKVKLTIDGSGAVSDVAVVEASPPKAKIFTEAATEALKQWKFEGNGGQQTTEMKLVFQQD